MRRIPPAGCTQNTVIKDLHYRVTCDSFFPKGNERTIGILNASTQDVKILLVKTYTNVFKFTSSPFLKVFSCNASAQKLFYNTYQHSPARNIHHGT